RGNFEDKARAREAFDDALSLAELLVAGDATSTRLVHQAGTAQQALRVNPGKRGAPLAARTPVAQLSARQGDLITFARKDARRRSRRALLAIVVGGGIALFLALALVASLVRSVRRPLESLVEASRRIADGDTAVRVREDDGPEEFRALGRSFNAMANDV